MDTIHLLGDAQQIVDMFYVDPFGQSKFELFLLTHCIIDSSTVICWMCTPVILGMSGLFCRF